jgi:N-acetylglutamate synthase-like GNAT family acetyltransferase
MDLRERRRMSDASGTRSIVQAHTLSASVRRAAAADAQVIADLVNQAYAVEGFFVDGDRTDAAEIERMMQAGTFLVLDHTERRGLAAAVYVTLSGDQGYFGMLAVGPGLQGRGVGTRMVRVAEAMAEAAGCTVMTMKIVNLREELGRWYRSLGYREMGTAPYVPHRPVKLACHFIEMARPLGTPVVLAA